MKSGFKSEKREYKFRDRTNLLLLCFIGTDNARRTLFAEHMREVHEMCIDECHLIKFSVIEADVLARESSVTEIFSTLFLIIFCV